MPSALIFVLCFLLLIAGILQIPRVKERHFITDNKVKALLLFSAWWRTQCCTLVISEKGAPNFLNGRVIGTVIYVKEANVSPPPSDSKDQVSTQEAKRQSTNWIKYPSWAGCGAWSSLISLALLPTGRTKVLKCFYCGPDGVSTGTSCDNQIPTFLRQVLKMKGAFWPKKEKLCFWDPTVVLWLPGTFAS